jgi:drug/metabolite transporter (DMT)-like permease
MHCLLLGEKIDRWKALSILLAFAGCSLAVEASTLSFLSLDKQGILAGVLSAGFFSSDSLLRERLMRGYNPWGVLLHLCLCCFLL